MYLFDLSGKVAVVTGGTRGIGMMMARGLLQAGASVYISSRKPEAGEAAAAELSEYGTVISVPADLAREEECLRLAAEVGRSEEGVHVLVNNRGATWGAPLADYPAEGMGQGDRPQHQSAVPVDPGPRPALLAAGTAEDPARVINIGSIDGIHVPYPRPTRTPHQGRAPVTRHLARQLAPAAHRQRGRAGPFESKMMAATLEAFGDPSPPRSPLHRIADPTTWPGSRSSSPAAPAPTSPVRSSPSTAVSGPPASAGTGRS